MRFKLPFPLRRQAEKTAWPKWLLEEFSPRQLAHLRDYQASNHPGVLKDFTPGEPFEWTPKIHADYAQAVKMAGGKEVRVRKDEDGRIEYWSKNSIIWDCSNRVVKPAAPPVPAP